MPALKRVKNFSWAVLVVASIMGAAYGVYHFKQVEPEERVSLTPKLAKEPLIQDLKEPEPIKQKPLVGILPTAPQKTTPKPAFVNQKESAFRNVRFIGFNAAEGLGKWQEKKYEKRTQYRILQDEDGTAILDADSRGTSSVIAKAVNIPPDKPYHLSWAWRVKEFPDRPNISFNGKQDNDYAVRVYVLYKGFTFLTPEVIQYVWDNHFPVGTKGTSPYTKRVKTIVIKSGEPESDDWVYERRNIIKDYEMLFGKKPKKDIQAIAVMSDSDNTESQAAAQVKDIWLQIPTV